MLNNNYPQQTPNQGYQPIPNNNQQQNTIPNPQAQNTYYNPPQQVIKPKSNKSKYILIALLIFGFLFLIGFIVFGLFIYSEAEKLAKEESYLKTSKSVTLELNKSLLELTDNLQLESLLTTSEDFSNIEGGSLENGDNDFFNNFNNNINFESVLGVNNLQENVLSEQTENLLFKEKIDNLKTSFATELSKLEETKDVSVLQEKIINYVNNSLSIVTNTGELFDLLSEIDIYLEDISRVANKTNIIKSDYYTLAEVEEIISEYKQKANDLSSICTQIDNITNNVFLVDFKNVFVRYCESISYYYDESANTYQDVITATANRSETQLLNAYDNFKVISNKTIAELNTFSSSSKIEIESIARELNTDISETTDEYFSLLNEIDKRIENIGSSSLYFVVESFF